VVSLDGDLQHPPGVITELLGKWKEGYQVVNTRRLDSADTSLFKRGTSRFFYWVFSKLSGVDMEAGSSDFRLLDRRAVDALCRMSDADLFIRGLVNWLGFRSTTVTYQAAHRHSGRTKFTMRRMLKFSTGALLSFSVLPLRLGIWIGFLTSLLALAEICYIVLQYFQGRTVPGWASVMTVLSFMFGVLFILIGIIGTYLGKIYEVLKSRPRYVVGDTTAAELKAVTAPLESETSSASGEG
jgi:dolichol-phosphate mannosyltransferase